MTSVNLLVDGPFETEGVGFYDHGRENTIPYQDPAKNPSRFALRLTLVFPAKDPANKQLIDAAFGAGGWVDVSAAVPPPPTLTTAPGNLQTIVVSTVETYNSAGEVGFFTAPSMSGPWSPVSPSQVVKVTDAGPSPLKFVLSPGNEAQTFVKAALATQ